MSDELQYPTHDEEQERPTPAEEKQRQRNHDQRNTDAVRQLISGADAWLCSFE